MIAVALLLSAAGSPGRAGGDDQGQTLRQQLAKLDDLRSNSATPIAALEARGKELLARYHTPEERGRIYFQLAHVYAQSDIRLHSARVTHYGRLALEHTFDPNLRGTLYSYLGSAAWVNPAEPSFAKQRALAAEEFLKGYRETLAFNLPAVAPELPVVEKIGDVLGSGSPEEQAAAKQKHEAQMKARREAEFIRDMVGHRDVFVRQLAELYGRPPAAAEELRRLATRILGERKAVEGLLVRVAGK
jgi:hypothetical protein